jgi:hypothetical protein
MYYVVEATTIGCSPNPRNKGDNIIPPATPIVPPSIPAKKHVTTTLNIIKFFSYFISLSS